MNKISQIFFLLLLTSSYGFAQSIIHPNPETKIYNYLDSNIYIENLFPEDTNYKELDIKFVKNKVLHSPGDSYFNVCNIKNTTLQPIKLDFKTNLPAGWALLNSNSFFSRIINPEEEINIPIRLSIPETVDGGIAYVINIIAYTNEKEFVGVTYVKIPELSDWDMESTQNKIYFNEFYNTEKFEIHLSNKGNTQEVINLNFKIGQNLKLADSLSKYNIYVSIPPFTDTVLSYTVQKSGPEQSMDYYSYNWKEKEILVTASGRNGKRKIKNYQFFDLDNEYYNRRDERSSPLNLDFSVANLASGINPFTNLGAFGQIQLNQSHDFDYSINFRNVSFQNGSNLRSYLNNPNLYFITARHNWNNNLQTTVGNINGNNPLFSFRGNGIESTYNLNNSSTVGVSLSRNRFFPAWLASSFYASKILIPGIKKMINYNFRLSYQDNSYMFFKSFSPQFGVSFSPIKKHNIGFNILTSFGSYDTTLGNTPNQDTSINGFAYSLNYNGSYKNISARVSQVNSKNNLMSFRGSVTTNSQVDYKINQMSSVSLTSNIFAISPSKLFLNQTQNSQFQRQSINRLFYQNRINKKISLSAGPSLQTTRRQEFINQNAPTTDFENQTFGLFGSMKFKLNNLESITPNVFFGNTRFVDKIIDSLNYNGATNISFGINYLTPLWGLNFRYIKGATFFIDPSTFLFQDSKISNETLFFRANYTKEIPSRNLKFHSYINYFLRMPKDVQNFGLSSRMDFQIIRRLNGFAMFNFFTNSMSNEEDGTSSSRFFNLNLGLTYNVDIPQPKIKYHDLKIVCFQDLNGDNIKSDNEPAIPNIILKISRDFESDFLNTLFYEKELISDPQGLISLNDLPEGDFFLDFRSIENLGVLYNTNGNEQEISMQEDYTLFVPYGEGYKVTGKVQISRDVNSDRGTVKPNSIRVEAISTSGERYTTLTDENGSYSISVPHPGYYKVSVNNVFGNDFYIKNNKMVIQFDGFKLFKLDFEVIEKTRDINIKGNSQFNFGNK